MPETKRPLKVFLCHAHSDAARVRGLSTRLKRAGVDVWLDKEKLFPGEDWELEIRKAVREADVVVVCLSNQFNQAGFRQKEVRLALDTAMEQPEGEIFIIPARLEECDTLESLRKWQWVDLFEVDGYQTLIRALRVRAEKINATLRVRKNGKSNISPPKRKETEILTEPLANAGGIVDALSDNIFVDNMREAHGKENSGTEAPDKSAREGAEREAAENAARKKAELNAEEKAQEHKAGQDTAATIEQGSEVHDVAKKNEILNEFDIRGDISGSVIIAGDHNVISLADKKDPEKVTAHNTQERVLEAAIEREVRVNTPASLFVWVRRHESKNIISLVSSIDEEVRLDEDNVKTKGLEIEFPVENGQVLPIGISLRLIASDFIPDEQKKKIIVPPEGDSEVCTFIVTPKKAGKLFLNIEVLKEEFTLASRTLWTTAKETENKEINPLVLVSIPIVILVRSSLSGLQTQQEHKLESIPEADQLTRLKIEKELITREKAAHEFQLDANEQREAQQKVQIHPTPSRKYSPIPLETPSKTVEQLPNSSRIIPAKSKLDVSPASQKKLSRKTIINTPIIILLSLICIAATTITTIFGSRISRIFLTNKPPTTTFTPTKFPTPSLTLTSIPTKTNTSVPTATLTPIPQSALLLSEDFEDGVANGWDTVQGTGLLGDWIVEKDSNGNHYWSASGPTNYPQNWYGDSDLNWTDYAFESRIQFIKGGLFICVRADSGSAFYTVFIDNDNGVINYAQYNPSKGVDWKIFADSVAHISFATNRWYTIRVEIRGNSLKTYVDNSLMASSILPNPIINTHGGIGFYMGGGTEFYFDDIKVWSLK